MFGRWKGKQLSIEALDEHLLSYAEEMGFGELHIKTDIATGLRAIIAIHSTQRGPALGGCRCIEYPNIGSAIQDAIRLARGMTYKAAISNVAHGGGKAVLIRPPHIENKAAYFETFGRFVHELAGRYITAVDSGTTTCDMDLIARQTRFVTSNTCPGREADPSPSTAIGVRRGIEAAVKFKFNMDSLENIQVAIQGVGHVGYHLAKQLHERGAKLLVTDINPPLVARCVTEFAATPVELDDIYSVKCDVFAPCALGGVLNDITIPKLKAWIIAGAANNQLALPNHSQLLQARDILYAPDYVVNAGGLIHAVAQYHQTSDVIANQQIEGIYDTLMLIFERAKVTNQLTDEIAEQIAAERL